MKMVAHLLIVAVISVGMAGCAIAQPGYGYTSANKKAIKYFEAADKMYRLPDPTTGRPNYKQIESYLDAALKKDITFTEAYMLRSQIYREQGRLADACDQLQKGVEYHPEFSASNLFFLAEMEYAIGRYESCNKHLKDFLALPRGKTNPDMQQVSMRMQTSCEFAIRAMKNPVPFEPTNLGPGVNTNNAEYFPTISGDDQMLLFTRLLPEPQAYGGQQEDFFYSFKDENGAWGNGKSVGRAINTIYNEGAPSLGADGQTLIFAACDLEDGYGANRDGAGSCDLFYTRKEGDQWVVARNIGSPINTFHWETQPSWSADGKTLYFIRGLIRVNGQRVGRPANPDIFFTQLQDNGKWSEPQRLPDYINTPGNEASVLIHPDGQTLYFASDGHIGMGGQDLYVCRKQPDGTWGKPVNLGYPINTWNDENSLLVSSSGDVAFFASDREGGFGDLDLYSFPLPESLRPAKTTYMKGVVYDVTDKGKLEAKFELIDLATGEQVVQSWSNPGNGEFLVTIPVNRDYALNVQKGGYIFYSKNFTLTDAGDGKPFLMDVPMVPISMAANEGVTLENVFFDVDKATLKPESKVELDKLVEYLKRNAGLHIELHGHTDSDGDDKHNLTLSDNRAKAVLEYLVAGGIARERLSAKGFGETKPKFPNDSAENKAKNRRTEYVITKF
jgi:outer membrane protein OmpA-like peptidoglycan-associated protein/Tol biopolymer transport system component